LRRAGKVLTNSLERPNQGDKRDMPAQAYGREGPTYCANKQPNYRYDFGHS